MVSLAKLLIISAFVCLIANGQYWDYYYQGNDWPGTCLTGYLQSPIAISDDTAIHVPYKSDISFQLYLSFITLNIKGFFNTYSYVLNGPWGSIISQNTTLTPALAYAQGLEFHAPSEHEINGRSFDLEMQILLLDPKGNKYKFAVVYELDKSIEGYTEFFYEVSQSVDGSVDIDLMKAFRDIQVIRNFIVYPGSLNTPPCTESMIWAVWSIPQKLSLKDLEFFTSKWASNSSFAKGNGNNREINPSNERPVYYFSGDDSHQDSSGSRLELKMLLIMSLISLY